MAIIIEEGKHYWATSGGYKLVVLFINNKFEVCGPWECGIPRQDVIIIEEIKEPAALKEVPLYYG